MNPLFRSAEAERAAWIRAWIQPPPRILVVDDDEGCRQLHADVLVDAGYVVDVAENGGAGWEALQTKSYDLVITDNAMPQMTGLEMIEKLRQINIKVPILMATGYVPVTEFANKPWLYPQATLQKPFSNESFLALVKVVLLRASE